MSKGKGKRRSPEQTSARLKREEARRREQRSKDAEAVGLDGADVLLEANANLEIRQETRDDPETGQKGTVKGGRRLDVLQSLKVSLMSDRKKPGLFDAMCRLERQLTIAAGDGDRGRVLERVDNGASRDRLDNMLEERAKADFVLAYLGAAQAQLAKDLLAPLAHEQGGPQPWRDIVRRHTGRVDPVRQVERVMVLAERVAEAYDQPGYRRLDGSIGTSDTSLSGRFASNPQHAVRGA